MSLQDVLAIALGFSFTYALLSILSLDNQGGHRSVVAAAIEQLSRWIRVNVEQ